MYRGPIWSADSIRWYRTASVRTGFHKKLAAHLLPHLKTGGTLCDVGCGLGLVDLELAPALQAVTCVDISEEAVQSLRADAQARSLENLQVLRRSWETLSGQWDRVLLCHFSLESPARFLPLCRELISVIGVNSGNLGPHGAPSKEGREARADAAFDALDLPWSKERLTLEFGQPLLSRADAAAFARHQSPQAGETEISAYLEENLVRLNDPVFPWYLPHPKELVIYHIKRSPQSQISATDSG